MFWCSGRYGARIKDGVNSALLFQPRWHPAAVVKPDRAIRSASVTMNAWTPSEVFADSPGRRSEGRFADVAAAGISREMRPASRGRSENPLAFRGDSSPGSPAVEHPAFGERFPMDSFPSALVRVRAFRRAELGASTVPT